MTESIRTGLYVGVAVVAGVLAWFVAPKIDVSSKDLLDPRANKPFFPDFDDPAAPNSMRVVAFNDDKAKAIAFSVEQKDEKWVIPSHHDYPADVQDRLVNTATSVLGLKREERKSTAVADQESLGTVDPLSEDMSKLKGRGKRITLSKGDTVLADYIIGKAVPNRSGYYYVRVPSEPATYVAKVTVDLSTKFSDWVETDLLKLKNDEIVDVVLDNYRVDELQGRIVGEEVNEISRAKPADPWQLKGIKPETEELDTSKVSALINELDNLKLVGVRPKPAGMTSDLKLVPGTSQEQARAIFIDLRTQGFFLTENGEIRSNEGDLIAKTSKGVDYLLRFGEIFTGDESTIEIGGKEEAQPAGQPVIAGPKASRYLFVVAQLDAAVLGPKPEPPGGPATEAPAEETHTTPPADTTKPPEDAPQDPPAGKPAPEEKTSPEGKSDKSGGSKPEESKSGASSPKADDDGAAAEDKPADKPAAAPKKEPAAGEAPTADAPKPAAPEKPAEDKPADKPAAQPAAEKPAVTPTDKPAEEATDKPAEKPVDKPADKPVEKPIEKPVITPDKAALDAAQKKYEADLKAYEAKLAAARETVKELNERFAPWYYVISSESFGKLRLSRKDLVKAKAAAQPGVPPEAETSPQGNPPEDIAP